MSYMYSWPERLADGAIHILGIVASITATTLLILYAAREGTAPDVAAVSVYGSMAVLAFTASAAYHMTPWLSLRPLFQRIDHAAIYFKIAGTYTPLVVILGGVFAYAVLALVWLIALVGAVGKMTQWHKPGITSTWLYVAMGWLSVVLIGPMVATLPAAALALIVAGGVLYSVGAIFNHWEELRYNVAIWHGFVLTASTLFFVAITLSLAAMAQAG
ncbi:MAG: hemolysin III family protein [Pseudomonadota bacterium]